MRVLIVPAPAASHVLAATPLAWALQNAGHEVRAAGQPSIVDTITNVGLVAVPVGVDFDLVSTLARPAAFGDQLVTSLELDDAEPLVQSTLRDLLLPSLAEFLSVPSGADHVEAYLELFRTWRPDLVVWDSAFFPPAVAAYALGVPHARLLWGRDWVGLVRRRFHELNALGTQVDVLAAELAPLTGRIGVEFDEQMLLGQVSIDPNPEEMRFDTGLDYLAVRWTPYTGPGVLPDWLSTPAPPGRVCVSLGVSYRELMTDDDIPIVEILRGLAGICSEVVATVDARQVDPSIPLPDNVRLVDFVPLSALLGTCDAIVHHGGTGTWGAAMQHDVPQVVAARKQIDYPAYGELVESAGAGMHVEVGSSGPRVTADAVVAGVRKILRDPSYRNRATAMRERLDRAPNPPELVGKLERFAGA